MALNKQEEALLIAERGRTRAFVDLMMERQTPQRGLRMDDNVISSVEQLIEVVSRQKASVLYYSLAAGYLYAWCIVPNKGRETTLEICFNLLRKGGSSIAELV